MMLDRDITAVSPVTTRHVFSKAGLFKKLNKNKQEMDRLHIVFGSP